MEVLFELLFEFFMDGLVAGSKSSKIPLFVRILLLFLFFAVPTGLLLFFGIRMIIDGVFILIPLLLFALCALFIYKFFSFLVKMRKEKRERDNNIASKEQ